MKNWPWLAILVLTCSGARAESVRLTDVVRQGVGDVDLLRDVTAAGLEAFRLEGSGKLTFAMDVNEAASGSEKASTQGVAIASFELEVTIAGTIYRYTEFSTDTQALLAAAGSETRRLTYTAIGSTGSNRITTNSIQGEFDDLIRLNVDRDLSAATRAVLVVRLLETNTSLGDPEAFYDYTNGFEDLALVNAADASYLEALAPGVAEAPDVQLTADPVAPELTVTGYLSYPSSQTFYTIGYEDLFPSLGDYDFNDLLVSYRVDVGLNAEGQVVQVKGVAFIVARGSGYSHDWHLNLGGAVGMSGSLTVARRDPEGGEPTTTQVQFQDALTFRAFSDTVRIFPPAAGSLTPFVNTEQGVAGKLSPRVDFLAQFDAPVPPSALGQAPFDPYLFVRNSGYEVHLPDRQATSGSLNLAAGLSSFRDENGYPFAFLLPANWRHPWERVNLRQAYPELLDYIRGNGKTNLDWYQRPLSSAYVRFYEQSEWEWDPNPDPE